MTFVIIKEALNSISITWFLFYRFLLASIITLVFTYGYILFKREKITKITIFNKKGWFLGIFLFGSYLFQTIGLYYTSPSNAAFITSLSVILVPLILVLKGNKLNKLNIISFSVATIGLALITINFSTFQLNLGDVVVLGTAIALAIQIVYTGEFAKDNSVLELTIAQLLCTTVLSLLTALIFEFNSFQPAQNFSETVIVALIFTALLATFYGYLVQTGSQKVVSPLVIAIIFTFEPIFALLVSLWVGEEVLNIIRVVGMMLIILATILAIYQENSKLDKESFNQEPHA